MIVSSLAETQSPPAEFGTYDLAGVALPYQLFVWMDTLDPSPLRLLRPIPVYIVRGDEGSIASFWGANIHSSGENAAEALAGLKTLVSDAYQMLTEHRNALGPEPSKQYAVLKEYIQPS